MGLTDFSLYDVIYRNTRLMGQKPALIDSKGTVDHMGLLREVDSLETGLRARGIEKGDRLAILGKNSREFITVYLAAAKIGAVVVPVNWRLNPDEIRHIIQDSSPKVILVGDEFYETLDEVSGNSGDRLVITLYGERPECPRYIDLLEDPIQVSTTNVSDDEPYIIIYTAAVDGMARGATLSQRNLLITSWQLANVWGLSSTDVNLSLLPLFHIFGVLLLFSALSVGGANVIMPGFEPREAVDLIAKHKVTIFGDFPPILQNLLEKAEGREDQLSSLRCVVGLEQPDTVTKLEKITKSTFWSVYGQTETSGVITTAPYFEKQGSAGRPLPLARVEIENDSGGLQPVGESGEIVTWGPSVFKGYWNMEAQTQRTFRFGRHHTGDKGRLDEDGFLFFEGRMPEKELIKPGGENVYPGEVERVINEHPEVSESCVFGVPDDQWGEAIKAVCALEPGATLTEADLIEFVAARIARYKKPKYVIFVSNLPKNDDHALDRDSIKEKYRDA